MESACWSTERRFWYSFDQPSIIKDQQCLQLPCERWIYSHSFETSQISIRLFPKRLLHGIGVVVMNSFVSRLIIQSPPRIFNISLPYDVSSFALGYFLGLKINLWSNSKSSSIHVEYLSWSKWHSLPAGLSNDRRKPTSKHPRITKSIFECDQSISTYIS